jgi:hypothetical protein
LALTPGSIVRRAAESIPEEQRFGAKEGAQIKRSKSGMSDNDRFFSENTRALATAKIGPKKRGQAATSCWVSEAPSGVAMRLFFLFFRGRQDSKKMLQ